MATSRGIDFIQDGTVHAFYQNRKGERFTILFDAVDLPVWEGWTWYVNSGYLVRRRLVADGPGPGSILFHCVLLPDAEEVDHINGNSLDNRRINLRAATRAENLRNRKTNKNNSSGVRGVCWNKQHRKWQAQIGLNGKCLYLGYFDSIEEAQAARLAAESTHFKDFAPSVSRVA